MNNAQLFDTTYPQRRLLYLTALNNAAEMLNSPLYIPLGNKVDHDRLQLALNALIERHEILRTSFILHNERQVQALHAPFTWPLGEEAHEPVTLQMLKQSYVSIEFDPAQLPLFKAVLRETADQGYWLCLDKHLLVADSHSDHVLKNDFLKLYRNQPLNEVEFQYVDFSLLQQQLLESPVTGDITQFWINTFKKEVAALHIPPDITMVKDSKVVTWKLDGAMYNSCITETGARHMEVPGLLLSCFYVLLYRYFSQQDLVVSCTLPGRNREEFDNTCGYFENIVPVRKTLDSNEIFSDFYKSVHRSWELTTTYQDVPFDAVIQPLRDNWNINTDKLFDIGFHYRRFTGDDERSVVNPLNQTLALICTEYAGRELSFTLSADPQVISKGMLNRFAAYFRAILTHVLAEPDTRIADIQMIPEQEYDCLLKTFNTDNYDFNITVPVHRCFEEQAARFPEQPAVICNDESVSYSALDRNANKLAWLISKIGITNRTFIGVYRDRDISLVVSLLGIMKAGGVYVPFDIQNPADRTTALLLDCQVQILITHGDLLRTQGELFAALPSLEYLICFEDLEEEKHLLELQTGKKIFDKVSIEQQVAGTLPISVAITDWAYMLYTSGSTGLPKGAITRHNGALNHIFAEFRALDLPTGFRFLQSANISSDISVWQILAPLLKGGAVVIIDQDDLLNYEKLHRVIAGTQVTILEFVPSFLNGWVDYLEDNNEGVLPLPALQWIMMVGEEVPVELVNRWFCLYPGTRVLNGYGPCEASDDIAQYAMSGKLAPERKKVPIGVPLTNLNIFILDRQAQLLPLGAIGEICVSGVGVGAGYWNKPANTTRSFIPNPFPGTEGDTIYRTGDLGRWLPDGNLEFWGRADNQVKIRGFRVETGEIEAVIRSYANVKDVAVVVRDANDIEKSLVAFIILRDSGQDRRSVRAEMISIRSLCEKRLPTYMIPEQFRSVDNIFQNLSGKVDRKQLLAMLAQQEEEDLYVPPANDTEYRLCELWKAVLNREQISIHANFFTIGGHSLKATQIISKIFKSWGVNLRLAEIFNNPTIAEQAHLVSKKEQQRLRRIEPVEAQDYYGLSHAQQRLWLLNYLEEDQTVYNIPSSYLFQGTLDVKAFDKAFKLLLERHESLRTSFHSIDGKPIQKIHTPEAVVFQIGYISLQQEPDRMLRAKELAEKELVEAFDLEQVPLLRAKLVQLEEDKCLFLFTMHHIISDGWSAEVLQNEFFALYHALVKGEPSPLKSLRLQYKDFVYWHNTLDFAKDEAYWLNRLAGNHPLIQLPYDNDGSTSRTTEGALLSTPVDNSVLQYLKKISAEKQTSLSNIFFTVFNILLYNISGQNELAVGVAVANRNHPDLESILGFFVNVMVISTQLHEEITFDEALDLVTAVMTAAYDHQDYPFDLLVSKLNPSRKNSQQPLFNVMYAFQNYAGLTLDGNIAGAGDGSPQEFYAEAFEKELRTARFDLTLYVFDQDDAASIAFEYNTSLFEEATVRNMMNSYLEFLEYASRPRILAVG